MTTWNSAALDLDAYLERVGYRGERTPTAEVLRKLQRGHVTSVPFENLEIQLGRPIELDLPSLQHKMVRLRRGGYCFEHTLLFAAALEHLGYGVEGLAARVRLGRPAGTLLPATHALLRVTVPATGRRWLCDVGFGQSSAEPAEFVEGAEVSADGWRFRLVKEGDLWVWQQLLGDEVRDAHAAADVPQYPVDYEVGSHYVSTRPGSPFVTRPYLQRVAGPVRYGLDLLDLRAVHSDGSVLEERTLEPDELPKILDEVFGIELDEPDHAALVERVRRLSTEA